MPKILILCTGNASRSQMAGGFLRSFDPRLEVHTAGTSPAASVHPMAIAVMKEAGIDISGARPQNVSQFLDRPFDYVITVCDNANESCPVFSGRVAHRLHIGFEDPGNVPGDDADRLAAFRRVRDEIRSRFHQLYTASILPAIR